MLCGQHTGKQSVRKPSVSVFLIIIISQDQGDIQ